MPTGTLKNVIAKQTNAGKKYLQISIDGTWGSYWNALDAQVGDQVTYEFTKKGEYTNYTNVTRGAQAAGTGVASDSGGTRRLVGDAKDAAITRMAVLRTAVQLLTPFEPKKGETPADRVASAVAIAERFRSYVEGNFQPTRTEAGPTEERVASAPAVDDSVFPTGD